MPATEIIEQKVFFKGLINSIDINPEEFLLPLQEVVVNSIQSIEDKGNVETGRIIIELIRKNETTLDFKDETQKDYNPIIGFTVKDNGIGFTSSRFDAFKTPFTDFGAKKHGCKGIGRYTVLACFGSMDIISFYTEEDKEHCRLLRFDNGKGLQKINDESITFPKENYTYIKLNSYKSPYLKFIEKNRIERDFIAEGLIQHCMLYFINKKAPTIIIKEEKEDLKDGVILNDIYRTIIKIENIVTDVVIPNVESKFNLNYIKNYNGVQSHSIHLCANNRQVGSKQTLTRYIPSFKELYDDGNKKYHLSLYVTSDFLDERAHPQRNRFSIPDKDEKLTEFDIISLEGLFKGLSEEVRSTYFNYILEAEKEKNERIRNYIRNDEKPRLRYNHLLKIENAFDEIPISATDETLEAKLHEISFKLEQKREKAFEKIFKKKKYDKEEFGKIVNEVLREEASFSKDKLADLMIQRKSIIKLFKKYLEWRDDGNYMLEEDLHNIIFTMGSDSDNQPYEYHNLWLLDERLAFHSFTASDKKLKSNDKLESDSGKEPDLFVYDIPCAYSDNPDKVNSLVLFEFKRPGRDMDNSEDRKLDKQLEGYFLNLLKAKAKNSKGRYINIQRETPKFGYIVCDLHQELIDYNTDWNGFKKTPYNTLYKVNSDLNLYYEVIDYNDLVDFAEKRHEVFFSVLGIDNL
ncbi:MAG: hypothetical protein JJU34_18900 [Lunatimonas sp.]|uniref:hypothetical protein n=1 Tax=Lunatimonas sp. TaxID=2060141 RepID=UPI00263BB7A9|nr:hypothetical protein [Lunatimonas sp.]MCC5939356.1 hypothetical protein [Lunatimonas sp.]